MNTQQSNRPLFSISIAASLTGLHSRTLMAYERNQLVAPHRTKGQRRLYSYNDLKTIRGFILNGELFAVNRAILDVYAPISAERSRRNIIDALLYRSAGPAAGFYDGLDCSATGGMGRDFKNRD